MNTEHNQPIYKQVYQSIKEKIEKEVYPVGMLLPTESELQQEYSVSRTTIRRTIALLQADGLIRVKQGYGTEILRNKVSQCMNSITSVSESLRKMGREVGVGNMYIERVHATYELAEELKVEVGDPLILINRIQTSDGMPITIAKNYIPEKFVPGIINEEEKIISLYKYINEKYTAQDPHQLRRGHVLRRNGVLLLFEAPMDPRGAQPAPSRRLSRPGPLLQHRGLYRLSLRYALRRPWGHGQHYSHGGARGGYAPRGIPSRGKPGAPPGAGHSHRTPGGGDTIPRGPQAQQAD